MAKKKHSYETALLRLEEIVQELENDGAGLEKSIELYKEGMELTLFCKNSLEAAEKEVMELKKNFEGEYTLVSFDENGDE